MLTLSIVAMGEVVVDGQYFLACQIMSAMKPLAPTVFTIGHSSIGRSFRALVIPRRDPSDGVWLFVESSSNANVFYLATASLHNATMGDGWKVTSCNFIENQRDKGLADKLTKAVGEFIPEISSTAVAE